MVAPVDRDYHEHNYLLKTIPGWATCSTKLREDGILLPYEQSRSDSIHPNPTLLQWGNNEWPMDSIADPMAGWPLSEVFATETVAENDISGKLFDYLGRQLLTFHRRLYASPVQFYLHEHPVDELVRKRHLCKDRRYGRIEVREQIWEEGVELSYGLYMLTSAPAVFKHCRPTVRQYRGHTGFTRASVAPI